MSNVPGATFQPKEGCTLGSLLVRPPIPLLEARILVGHALALSRIQLITQSERILNKDEAERVSALVNRRLAGEPIAYIVGEREFFGLALKTTPAVLIPRPDTELLVELALERLPPGGSLLDMGTGSGAIAIAVAHTAPQASVTASDVSEEALTVAKENAARHQAKVEFLRSDWYEAVGNRRFDVIASNPPYILANDPHLSEGDLRFEPAGALTDNADGLSALRILIEHAPEHLAPAGWLLMEHGYDQSQAVRQLLQQRGFKQVRSWEDLAGIERVSGGCLNDRPAR
jgi:release factor glutamine methyltransferase